MLNRDTIHGNAHNLEFYVCGHRSGIVEDEKHANER